MLAVFFNEGAPSNTLVLERVQYKYNQVLLLIFNIVVDVYLLFANPGLFVSPKQKRLLQSSVVPLQSLNLSLIPQLRKNNSRGSSYTLLNHTQGCLNLVTENKRFSSRPVAYDWFRSCNELVVKQENKAHMATKFSELERILLGCCYDLGGGAAIYKEIVNN